MNDEPGKQSKSKGKKGGLLPWVVGAGLALGGWYFYDRKKKAQALEGQRQQELLRQEQEAQKGGPGEVPASTLNLPLEGHFSASERLKGMGVDPTKPGHYQECGDPYAG